MPGQRPHSKITDLCQYHNWNSARKHKTNLCRTCLLKCAVTRLSPDNSSLLWSTQTGPVLLSGAHPSRQRVPNHLLLTNIQLPLSKESVHAVNVSHQFWVPKGEIDHVAFSCSSCQDLNQGCNKGNRQLYQGLPLSSSRRGCKATALS